MAWHKAATRRAWLPSGGIEGAHGLDAQFDGAPQVFLLAAGEFLQLRVLFGDAGDLGFQGAVELLQLRVHGLGFGLQAGVVGNQVVALHGVLDRGQQFLAQPGFDDEAVNFPLVDRVNDRAQAQHGGDEDAGGVGLDFAHLGQEFQAR